ncbi:hypothetical protein MAR_013904 [Mya arenaria]|uniref:Uncharacterized protein n=1 Tax=Mya arenaria TaxID=6604 RepID=A0ABY7G1U3_MYAAR|nr:hypothetical protein MAR_013904 [Mya arenaria]
MYFSDKCMPMGCSISCSTFETVSTFLEWAIKMRTGMNNIDHYLDQCKLLLDEFSCLCQELAIPVADVKNVGPVTCITYLGYEPDLT